MSVEASEAFWAKVAGDAALEAQVLALIKDSTPDQGQEIGSLRDRQDADSAAEAVAALARGLGFDVSADDVADECWAVLEGPDEAAALT